MARRGQRSGVSQLPERCDVVAKPRDLRPKCHLDVRRSLSIFRGLRLLIAQFLLQLGERCDLESFQGDYTVMRSSRWNCARNTRLHSFIMETIDHMTPREALDALVRRNNTGAIIFCVSLGVLDKGVPGLSKCHPLRHVALGRSYLRRMPSEVVEVPDVVVAPLIRHRIKVLFWQL
ncbi:hypothetical protein PI125_g8086 [Phytophthora idaei]|nr:hypothetical protein PI125_g8086 [Phytophthora idaei]KAG3130332.1 hypothetical protein PI126_g20559 [Phytophthora idaei]